MYDTIEMRDLTDLCDYYYSMMGMAQDQDEYDRWSDELVKVEKEIASFIPVMEDN